MLRQYFVSGISAGTTSRLLDQSSFTFVSVLLLATAVLSNTDTINTEESTLPDVLQNVLRRYGKNFETDIEYALRKKVIKLIPYLDDNKHAEKKSRLRNQQNGDVAKSNPMNKKYKRLRKEIEKLFEMEPVSENTKTAVIYALDQITEDLMSKNCLWRKNTHDVKIMNVDQPDLIMKHIREKWNKMFDQYSIKYIRSNETARKAFALLSGLRNFVFDVHEEYKRLASLYAMKCDIVYRQNKLEPVQSVEVNLSGCDKVCSAELFRFLSKFHKQLKITYSDVLNNYVRMYHHEVNNGDADSLADYIPKMAKNIEKKFEESIEKLVISKNHTTSALEAVSITIDKVLDETKKIIDKSLQDNMKGLSPKLRMTVREDLKTTTNIELGNLRQDIKNSICAAFQTCNSVTSRKYIDGNDAADPNSIRFNLKIGFNKPVKNVLEVFNNGNSNNDVARKNAKDTEVDTDKQSELYRYAAFQTKSDGNKERNEHDKPYDISKYGHVNVTRTTLQQTNGVTTQLIAYEVRPTTTQSDFKNEWLEKKRWHAQI